MFVSKQLIVWDLIYQNLSKTLIKSGSVHLYLSKQNCPLNLKSTYCTQNVESSSEERVTKQSDGEKSGDDSESIRFIPPKSKSSSAKKVEHLSKKDDQSKQQHQEVNIYN